jgi:hypothetical protein
VTSQIRLVIADDHPIVRQGLRQVIEKDAGLQVVAEAGDGPATLEQIKATQPRMVMGSSVFLSAWQWTHLVTCTSQTTTTTASRSSARLIPSRASSSRWTICELRCTASFSLALPTETTRCARDRKSYNSSAIPRSACIYVENMIGFQTVLSVSYRSARAGSTSPSIATRAKPESLVENGDCD